MKVFRKNGQTVGVYFKKGDLMKKAEEELIKRKAEEFSSLYDGEISAGEFSTLMKKCAECRSIEFIEESDIDNWYSNRFKPNVFKISEDTYLKAMIEALKIQFLIAGTDFGSSRQRDLGQKWSDTIRGYLGEFGTQQWFKERWDIDIDLGHEEGTLEEYLPTDIHAVKTPSDTELREPNLKVSIKSTKSNGIWLDIPGDQFHHSDIFILTKLIITTDHLFSFFKAISVFEDKILKCGLDKGYLTQEVADQIYDNIPSFKPVYGYIAGFVEYAEQYESYNYEYSIGRTNAKLYGYSGVYEGDETLREIKRKIDSIETDKTVKNCEFVGIGKFNSSKRYVFGMRNLRYTDQDWNSFVVSKI